MNFNRIAGRTALMLLLCSGWCHAATITVGISGCDFTDLQAAIDAASAGDELRLRAQTFSDTNVNIGKDLTLRGGYSVCGDEFPALGETSSIVGAAAAADSTVEVFGASSSVTLVKLEISGGTSDTDFGGGIEVGAGAEVTLATVTVTANESSRGGGIYLEPGATLLHSGPVTVSLNSANDGAGIYAAEGALINFASETFSPVDILDNDGLNGGGIYLAESAELKTSSQSTVTLSGGLAAGGGGIYAATNALIDAPALEINDNEAIQGGGLYVDGGGTAATVTSMIFGADARFEGNSATNGGAVHLASGGGYDVELSGTFFNNQATQNGGAIYFDGGDGGALNITLGNIVGNSADSRGGGIYQVGGRATIALTSVHGGQAGVSGGGIHLSGAVLDAGRQTRIFGNTAADSGGGISLVTGSELLARRATGSFYQLTVQDNEAQAGDGGGIYLSASTMQLEWALIGGPGGGNRAPAGNGGGIFADTGSGWSIENFQMNFNHAGQSGGAIYATGGGQFSLRPVMAETSLAGRGADDVPACDPFSLESGTYCAQIRENSAGFRAGGVYLDDVDGNITATALLDNISTNSGVALYLTNGSLTIRHSLIARNGSGVAMFTGTAGNIELEHVSLVDNEAAGIAANDKTTTLHMDKSLFWDNGGADVVPAVGQDATGACNLGAGILIPDALNADPLLVQTARGRYRLGEGSPALDACDFGFLTLDLDGVRRPTGAGHDIGALEGEWIISEEIFADRFEESP